MKHLLASGAALALVLFPLTAFAQSTATPVLPGLLTTSGCPVGQTVCYVPYSGSNPLPVSGSFTPSGNQIVIGPTADGSPSTTAPVQIGGTADGTSTGNVGVVKVDAAGNLSTTLNIGGNPPSLINPIWVANAEAADTTGTFTNGTQTTSITNSNADGYAAGLISINGTYATASGVFEVSDDGGVTFYSVICARSDGTASETGYTSLTNTNRQWSCPVGGNDSLRVRSTAVATGTLNARVGVSAPPPSSNTVAGTLTVTQPTASALNGTMKLVDSGGTNLGAINANGGLAVSGDVAAGATDSGNPVKVGGVALSTQTAVTSGQRKDLQTDLVGNLRVDLCNSGNTAPACVVVGTFGDAVSNSINSESTAAFSFAYNGTTFDRVRNMVGATAANTGVLAMNHTPCSIISCGTTGTASSAVASSLVLKASPGNLYSVNVVTGATAGFVMFFNATSAPADGAVTPAYCMPIAANSGFNMANTPMPTWFTTGITIVFSSTGCYSKTASATAFIAGQFQ